MLGVRVWRDLKRQEKCDSGNFMISLGGVMPYNGIRAIGHRASWLKSSSAKGPSWGTSLIFLNSNIFLILQLTFRELIQPWASVFVAAVLI